MARLAVLLAVCGVLWPVGALRKMSKLHRGEDTPGGSATTVAGTYEVLFHWTNSGPCEDCEGLTAVISSDDTLTWFRNQEVFWSRTIYSSTVYNQLANVPTICDRAQDASATMYMPTSDMYNQAPFEAHFGHWCFWQDGVNIAFNSYSVDGYNAVGELRLKEWTLVARQTYPGMFQAGEWAKNSDDDRADNYAILDQLESFRDSRGGFEFKLSWPSMLDQIWRQTSNPLLNTGGGVDAYEAISTPYSAYSWGGLEYGCHSGCRALLDGSINSHRFWYSVGAIQPYVGGLPGPAAVVQRVELFVKTM